MKYTALLFVFIFIVFAGLQINDPDPVWWITIYMVAAYASYQAFRKKNNRELLIILAILYLAGGVNSALQITKWEGFNTEDLSMKTLNQELARESSGLIICFVLIVVYIFSSYFDGKRGK